MNSDPQSSVWKHILGSSVKGKKSEVINVIVLGDKSVGKKRLLEIISKQFGEFSLFKNELRKHKDQSSTYLMDFQYIQIKFSKEEGKKLACEINIFIVNFPSEKVGVFILRNLMRNLQIWIVVRGKTNQQYLQQSYQWNEFLRNSLRDGFGQLVSDEQNQLIQNMEECNQYQG